MKKPKPTKKTNIFNNPFSKVQENQTFFVAIHMVNTTTSNIADILAAIPECLAHLKQFKMVLILFGGQIEQLKIFTEKNISELANFSIPKKFVEGNDVLDVLSLTNSFDTSGFGKYIFIHTTVDLKCSMITQYVNALYKIVWFQKHGLDDNVGERILLNFGNSL